MRIEEDQLTSRYAVLPGSERQLLPNSRRVGSINGNEVANLTIHVRSIQELKELEEQVHTLYAVPLSEREYLTHEQAALKFGARPEDLDRIENYVHLHSLIVTHRSSAERSVHVQGRLKDLLAAFPASIAEYHHARGSYRGRQGIIQIPEQLKDIVTGIFGFDTRPKRRSRYREVFRKSAGGGSDNGVPSTDFAQRYNFPKDVIAGELDGTGQTIAIIELGGGYRTSDLQTYFQDLGLNIPKVVAVLVGTGSNSPTDPDSADGEVMLDIEVAGAVAPGARIAVYFAPNTGNGFLDAITAALNDVERKPSVISISWGEPEDFLEQQSVDAYHEVFVRAAALGVTICVASGDHGTADLKQSEWDERFHVDHPSSDPFVLSCGGTQVDPSSNRDVVWNDGTGFDDPSGNGGWASGGGVSTVFPVPDYQSGVKIPLSLGNGKTGRGVPDIAMSATNYFVRVDGVEAPSGGTSAVAPLMAALVGLLNQAKKKNIGFVNPFLYANAKQIMNDVTRGTNGLNQTIKGYKAGVGWDACSGLGTPDGQRILQQL